MQGSLIYKSRASVARRKENAVIQIFLLAKASMHQQPPTILLTMHLTFWDDPFTPYAVSDDMAYFVANDRIRGSGLCRSDDSFVGTYW